MIQYDLFVLFMLGTVNIMECLILWQIGYRTPGSNLENLKSELGLFKSRLEKIKVCIKATNPLSACSRGLHIQRYCLARHTQQIRLTVESVRGRNDDRSYERSWTGTVSALPYPAEKNTLDLIIIPIPSQFVDIHSPDRPSDHNRVSGTLKVVILPIKKPKRKVYRYQKGDYESMIIFSLNLQKKTTSMGTPILVQFKIFFKFNYVFHTGFVR